MGLHRKSSALFTTVAVLCLSVASSAHAGTRELASRMFQRLAGYALPLNDPRRVTMETQIAAGNFAAAAAVATADPGFINATVRQWAAPMSNLDNSRRVPLNDFIATVMGAVRDNLDARTLLTDDRIYVVDITNPEISSNTQLLPWDANAPTQHFARVDIARIDVQRYLVTRFQETALSNGTQVVYTRLGDAAAGLLTTHSWAAAHLVGGTNRRPIAYAFKEFLCKPIESLSDTSVSDARVRRDVDREPGGVGGANGPYQTSCRGCHAGMDALAGAYAKYAYPAVELRYTPNTVQAKMNQNGTFSPTYVTTDDSWINLWTQNQNASLGWTGPLSGNGVRSFGSMLANSDAFAACMVTRTFAEVCGSQTPAASVVTALKDDFKTNGYKLKRLFERTASQQSCLGR